MGFKGMEQLNQDTPLAVSGGGWVKLVDDVPVTVKVLEYGGVTHSKKFPEKAQYRFLVETEDGTKKHLDTTWRLMKLLKELAKTQESAFVVRITQSKKIADIKTPEGVTKKQLINDYTATLIHETPLEDDAGMAG